MATPSSMLPSLFRRAAGSALAQRLLERGEEQTPGTDAAATKLYLEQVTRACAQLAAMNKVGAGGSGTLSAPPTPLSDSPSFSSSTPVPAHLVHSVAAARRIVQQALQRPLSTPLNSSALQLPFC